MDDILLFDYTDERGQNLIMTWIEDDAISRRDRAKLNQKLDSLVRIDYNLAIQTKMLAKVFKHILKLKVHGEVQMRPLLCRGPVALENEYTLLMGAVETGGKLPENAKESAAERRTAIHNEKGLKHRCTHERFA